MADEFCLKMPDFHVTFRDLLHVVNLRHGTDGFTSPPKGGMLRMFFALKNPNSVWFEPANLGTKRQHATSRLPKPLTEVKHIRVCVFTTQAQNLRYYKNTSFNFRSPYLSLSSGPQAVLVRNTNAYEEANSALG